MFHRIKTNRNKPLCVIPLDGYCYKSVIYLLAPSWQVLVLFYCSCITKLLDVNYPSLVCTVRDYRCSWSEDEQHPVGSADRCERVHTRPDSLSSVARRSD